VVGSSLVFGVLGKESCDKKFWKELTAYFPLIQNGPHRKRRVEQFSYSVCIRFCGNVFLPSRCLATIGGINIQTHRLVGRIYEVRR
jgi:hypothetical protein